MRLLALFFILLIVIPGCVVKGPKFTEMDNIMQLKLGMTYSEVNQLLKINPYDVVVIDSTGQKTLIYKYRTTDRKTVPMFLKPANGKEIWGKYRDLYAHFTPTDTLFKMYSVDTDSELKEKRLDINGIITFMTVTVPAVLILLGIKQSQ
jgi:hypothetical protein